MGTPDARLGLMRNRVALARLIVAMVIIAATGPQASAQLGLLNWLSKLDPLLQQRASLLTGRSRIILRASDSNILRLLTPVVQLAGGTLGRSLPIINSVVADVPNTALPGLAGNALVLHISMDRLVAGAMERTGATVGATAVRQELGYDGAGIVVVVAAAGNDGRSPDGRTRYGGITAPGNAPWVLTVGASSHMGTVNREDDTMAAFSSRGPGTIDYAAKPDLVAPGVGIESLSDPDSAFYTSRASSLLSGTVATTYMPYLSLSGTSMAAPVVSGTVALMLRANPDLTPNEVKAILQYTSQTYAGYDRLTQGAGFLNARGAVELARFLAASSGAAYPSTDGWSTQLIWGQRLVQGGLLAGDANAWPTNVIWGATAAPGGHHITWGSGFTRTQNVVRGSQCGFGADCQSVWTISGSGGADDGDTVVWGTDDGDTVVWGTSCDDPSCEPMVWNRP